MEIKMCLKEFEVVEESFDYKAVANDYNDYVELCENIRESESSALQNFFDIGCYLNEINDRKLYLLEDYIDIYEFALNKFGYKTSSVNNFINVYLKYKRETNDYLAEDFEEYSYSALVELLPVPKEEIVEKYTPVMSVKEIRKTKKILKLSDYSSSLIKRADHILKNIIEPRLKEFNVDIPDNYKVSTRCSDVCLDFENLSWYYYIETKNYFGGCPFNWGIFKILFDDGIIKMLDADITNYSDEDVLSFLNEKLDKHKTLVDGLKAEKELNDSKPKAEYSEKHYSQCLKSNLYVGIFEFIKNVIVGAFEDTFYISTFFRIYNDKDKPGFYTYITHKGNNVCSIVFNDKKDYDNIVVLNQADYICSHLDTKYFAINDRGARNSLFEFITNLTCLLENYIVSHNMDDEEDVESIEEEEYVE